MTPALAEVLRFPTADETWADAPPTEALRECALEDRVPVALQARKVLVAEDNASMRRLIARALRQRGHEVIEVGNGFELMHWVDLLTQWRPDTPVVDLIVTDHRMPMFSGLECLQQLHFSGNGTPVIMITAFGDPRLHQEALEHGVRSVFDKPLDLAELCAEVNRILG